MLIYRLFFILMGLALSIPTLYAEEDRVSPSADADFTRPAASGLREEIPVLPASSSRFPEAQQPSPIVDQLHQALRGEHRRIEALTRDLHKANEEKQLNDRLIPVLLERIRFLEENKEAPPEQADLEAKIKLLERAVENLTAQLASHRDRESEIRREEEARQAFGVEELGHLREENIQRSLTIRSLLQERTQLLEDLNKIQEEFERRFSTNREAEAEGAKRRQEVMQRLEAENRALEKRVLELQAQNQELQNLLEEVFSGRMNPASPPGDDL